MTNQQPPQYGAPSNPSTPPYQGGASSWDYNVGDAGEQAPQQQGWTPAPKAGLIPLRPLSFGEIFGSTFKLLRTNAAVSIGASLIAQGIGTLISVLLPVLVGVWMINRLSQTDSLADQDVILAATPGWLLLSIVPGILVTLLASALVQVIVIQVVAQSILGRRVKLGEAIKKAWSRVWPLLGYIGITIVVSTVAVVVLVAAIALAGIVLSESTAGIVLLIFMIGIAGLGLFVLYCWIYTKLAFVVPAIVLEHHGPIRAIRRSWGLSKGYFWRTLLILLLVGAIVAVAGQAISTLFAFAMNFLPAFLMPTGGVAEGQEGALIAFVIVLAIISIVVSVLVAALTVVLLTGNIGIMYTDLRMRKEGLNIHLQNAVETYSQGREPENDPWTAPDLGPLIPAPQPQPYAGQAYPPQAYQGQAYPGQAYPGQAYPQEQYSSGQPYAEQQYPGQQYAGQQYAEQQQYSGQSYPQSQDPHAPYSDQQYPQNQDSYLQQPYGQPIQQQPYQSDPYSPQAQPGQQSSQPDAQQSYSQRQHPEQLAGQDALDQNSPAPSPYGDDQPNGPRDNGEGPAR